MEKKITYIDEVKIEHKRILLRADFDVSLNENFSIADDVRLKDQLPTITYLFEHHNKIICVAKLGRPQGRDMHLSLSGVVKRLQEYLPQAKVRLIDDFLTEPKKTFEEQTEQEIFVLENIRFYPGEKANDPAFAKKLADLADVYVNNGFAISHRKEASVVGVPALLPSFGGLLLKKEIEIISRAIREPQKPFVVILGGAKITDKIGLVHRLIEIADYVLIGGGLANTFLCSKGLDLGKSFCEPSLVEKARELLFFAAEKHTAVLLPTDVVVGDPSDPDKHSEVYAIQEVPPHSAVYDIGPETTAKFGNAISKAHTIIWNGPVGLFENPHFRRGTDFIYYSIAHNDHATSIVGGGDTIAAISDKEYLNKITHISTGGGAMLEFIEKGTLPGIEVLKQ